MSTDATKFLSSHKLFRDSSLQDSLYSGVLASLHELPTSGPSTAFQKSGPKKHLPLW